MDVLEVIFYVVSIGLHSCGFYLLFTLYRNSGEEQAQQTIFILNLSVVEILGNVIQLATFVVIKVSPDYVPNDPKTYLQIIIIFYGILYSLNLILMAVDQIFFIVSMAKHSACCTLKMTKAVLAVAWIVVVILYVTLLKSSSISVPDFIMYLTITLDIVFIAAAAVFYLLVIHFFNKSNQNSNQIAYLAAEDPVYTETFCASRFCIPCLLVANFLILVAIPDLIYQSVVTPDMVNNLVFFLVLLSHVVDGIIYIFLQTSIRRILWRSSTAVRVRFSVNDGDEEEDRIKLHEEVGSINEVFF